MSLLRHTGSFRWEGVPVHDYKPEGTHFRDVTRQVLIGEGSGEGSTELRYFELAAEGHTTLERHEHRHEVMILCGQGRALIGDRIVALRTLDLLRIPPMTWHQFRAAEEPLGFLCWVDRERDRPRRPDPAELAELRRSAEIASFIRI